jgi:hypothetical protein
MASPAQIGDAVSKSNRLGISDTSIDSLKNNINGQIPGPSAESPPEGRRAAPPKVAAPPPYVDDGPAPWGSPCTICGKNTGAVKRIRYGRRVSLWHRACADRQFAGEPTRPPQTPEAPSP